MAKLDKNWTEEGYKDMDRMHSNAMNFEQWESLFDNAFHHRKTIMGDFAETEVANIRLLAVRLAKTHPDELGEVFEDSEDPTRMVLEYIDITTVWLALHNMFGCIYKIWGLNQTEGTGQDQDNKEAASDDENESEDSKNRPQQTTPNSSEQGKLNATKPAGEADT